MTEADARARRSTHKNPNKKNTKKLVNNAGSSLRGPLVDVPLSDARALFESNFFGAAELTRAAAPSMIARRAGVIINIGSVSSLLPPPFLGYYAASKAALAAVSASLRVELAPFGKKSVFLRVLSRA